MRNLFLGLSYKTLWNGGLVGVLASMLVNEDKIKGSSFIDFGAGSQFAVRIIKRPQAADIDPLVNGQQHRQLVRW